jgi:CO dehydrogenase maturation factor
MSRGTVRHVDTVLIVIEPYYRSLETAGRMAPLARGLGIQRVYGVANKLRSAADEAAVADYCAKHDIELVARIPFDEAIVEADRAARALIDYRPDSPAMAAIRELAARLMQAT